MDLGRLSRAYLESLSTKELIRLADSYGVDVPFDLDRIFIIEQLLDIAAEDEADLEAEIKPLLEEADIPGPVPLPKQYNITFIEVMIRDPLWAFAFWEIKSSDKENFEKAADFEGYRLDVYYRTNQASLGQAAGSVSRRMPGEGLFTVSVGPEDSAWYLGFPPEAENRCYEVELCADMGSRKEVLAVSRPFRLPRLIGLPAFSEENETCEIYKNPLLRLSGVEDFHILRNGERITRTKTGRPSGE